VCKVFCGASLALEGKKAENNLCYVEGICKDKIVQQKKTVQFSDKVQVFFG
jgi:hypothetical protein